MVQKVAVIGAGMSGLTSIKSCLEEGLEPTCFESGPDIGGLWRFKEPEPGRANIYESVVLNSSKERMAFSDFRDGRQESEVFDAVMVCTGLFTTPNLPLKDFPGTHPVIDCKGEPRYLWSLGSLALTFCGRMHWLPRNRFDGIESFTGEYFHSRDYRNAEGMRGKRVVVIGIGSSGKTLEKEEILLHGDLQVYLCSRSGAWVVSRVGARGFPADMMYSSRVDQMLKSLFPSHSSRIMENKLNQVFDHELYGLKPRHRYQCHKNTVVSDALPARIISGRIRLKENIKEFRGSTLVFADGSAVDQVDVVVFATGYKYSFPFLPPNLREKSGFHLCLYKHVFPPSLSKPTLAMVGLILGQGGQPPLAEMHARWATRVFKGLAKLPTEEMMLDKIATETGTMNQRYKNNSKDHLASQIGVKPNMALLLLKDPRLAFQVLFGPFTSYQYRLSGPGRWAGARQAIFSQWDRVVRPFNKKVDPKSITQRSELLSLVFGIYCLVSTPKIKKSMN
uniref:Flavin-containing monooxygenase n=1 Tax=Hippocampus comes TaxID=109280 RepID=A0A3Q3DKH0_HIPCM